jgi:hypothetical protein
MPPMDRDEEGRCRKKNGRIAGQTARRIDPPRTEVWSFKTTPARFEWFEAQVAAGGFGSRADCVDDASELFAGLLGLEPLPVWLAINEVKKG